MHSFFSAMRRSVLVQPAYREDLSVTEGETGRLGDGETRTAAFSPRLPLSPSPRLSGTVLLLQTSEFYRLALGVPEGQALGYHRSGLMRFGFHDQTALALDDLV